MIGEIINDKYRVLDQMSEDRLATSYLARDQVRNEMVVLKLIRPEITSKGQFLEGFRVEAEKLHNLTSPLALKALDWGDLEAGPYVIFEYTSGNNLTDVCQAQRELPVEQALTIASQLGLCLAGAHARDLVHGDLRPDHILLTGDDQIRVTNFGLARALDLGRLVADGELKRDEYHAPELAAGAAIDSRADLYSLGAILFEMLTGQRPASMDPGQRLSHLRADLPPEIDDLVARCLASEPDNRPQSAAEFLEGIDETRRAMSTAPARASFGIEEALAGHTLGAYRLVEKLGRGGMATVYKAYEPTLDRYVAVKVLPQHFAADPTFRTRFRREAKAIARLNHPNIVPVFNFGEAGDLTYIAMQYVEGGTLKETLGQPMGTERALKLALQIARALSYAHKRDVVHRDVKPANVLLAEGDWPLLSDFGLARMMSSSVQITQTGVGVGTPAYMSPEQGQGLKADGRSDIYSLGIMLYEMLTGAVPFQADTPLAVVLKHITAPLPMPSKINPNIPESVERIILKATAKEPDHRYKSADEMIESMEKALAGLPFEAATAPAQAAAGRVSPGAPPAVITQPPTSAGPDISAATEVLAHPKPAPRVPVWALGLAGVLVLAGLIVGVVLLGLIGKTTDRGAMETEVRASPTTAEEAQTGPVEPAGTPTVADTQPMPAVSPGQPPKAGAEVKVCAWDNLGPGLCIHSRRGGQPVRILKDSDLEFVGLPSWSPDGGQIAFSALKPGGDPSHDNRIYVVNADGSGLTELPALGNDISPAWSPDGEWLVFHSSCSLGIMRPDGSDATLLWRSQGGACAEQPQWSPDGGSIVASMPLGGGERTYPMTREIWVFARNGTHYSLLRTTYESDQCVRLEVAYSPDGSRIAYVDEGCQSWAVNADGSGQAQPLEEFPGWWTSAFHPQWGKEAPPAKEETKLLPTPAASKPASPPAEPAGKIAEPCEDVSPAQICARDSQTGQVTRVSDDLAFEEMSAPAWSPDGKQLVFAAGSAFATTGQHDHKLYLINADGSDVRQITSGDTNDLSPAWSPDGEWIAFHRNCDLWLVRPDGSEAQRVLERSDTFCALMIAWSPDSQQIAFANLHSTPTVPRTVHIVQRDGSDLRVVHTFEDPQAWAHQVAWSPDGGRLAVWYEQDGAQQGLLINADGSGEAQIIKEMPRSWLPSFWPQWGGERKAPEAAPPPADPWGQVVVPPGEPVRLAFVGALSGEAPGLGEVEKNGFLMAIEDQPLVHGFQLEAPMIVDSGCTDEGRSREAAESVVSNPEVVGVIGHTCSVSCAVGAAIYAGAHLVTISPSCTAPRLSGQGYEVFNRVAIQDEQGGDERNRQVINTDSYRDFDRRYQERYGQPLDSAGSGYYAAYAYDATVVLIQAIERAAVVDEAGNLVIGRQALARAVRATPDYVGLTGGIRFDDKGDRLP